MNRKDTLYLGINKELVRKTKSLLRMYRETKWLLENNLYDFNTESLEYHDKSLVDAIDALIGMSPKMNLMNIENRLKDLKYCWHLIKLIDTAVGVLKTYPENGEFYYELIDYTFLKKESLSESDIIAKLNVSRTKYFKDKNAATILLSKLLF